MSEAESSRADMEAKACEISINVADSFLDGCDMLAAVPAGAEFTQGLLRLKINDVEHEVQLLITSDKKKWTRDE